MDMSTDERKRGRWLSGWLILLAILYAWLAYQAVATMVTASPDPSLSDTPQWVLPLLIVLAIVNVGAAIALWFWRKIGFYLFVITAIPLVIINLMLGVQVLIALFPLYSVSSTWVLLRPRWQYFYRGYVSYNNRWRSHGT
jgi:hypothetical protein